VIYRTSYKTVLSPQSVSWEISLTVTSPVNKYNKDSVSPLNSDLQNQLQNRTVATKSASWKISTSVNLCSFNSSNFVAVFTDDSASKFS